MKEKTSKERASEKWRIENKEYYNNYYKEYRKTHKPKNYTKIYRERLEKIIDYIIEHTNNFAECLYVEETKELYNIAMGENNE